MPLPWLPHIDDKQLFQAQNAVLPVWLLLVLAPRWRGTHAIALLTAAVFAMLYTGLMVNDMLDPNGVHVSISEFTHWDGVARLFSIPTCVLPVWVHYLSVDLMLGRWMAQTAVASGIPQLVMAPVLMLTCAFAPAGLLLYLIAVKPWFGRSGSALKRD